MPRRQLGQLEAEVLAVLATAEGPLSAAGLQAGLAGEAAYTTVNTVLFRLHDKGLVTRAREGRHFLYRLAVDESQLVASRMRDQLRYASDPSGVLSQFIQALGPAEEQAVRDILNRDDSPTGDRDKDLR